MDLSRLDGVVFYEHRRTDHQAQLERRAWRTKERAANLAPLSAKIKHRGGKIEVAPQPKKRGGK